MICDFTKIKATPVVGLSYPRDWYLFYGTVMQIQTEKIPAILLKVESNQNGTILEEEMQLLVHVKEKKKLSNLKVGEKCYTLCRECLSSDMYGCRAIIQLNTLFVYEQGGYGTGDIGLIYAKVHSKEWNSKHNILNIGFENLNLIKNHPCTIYEDRNNITQVKYFLPNKYNEGKDANIADRQINIGDIIAMQVLIREKEWNGFYTEYIGQEFKVIEKESEGVLDE